MSSLIYSLKKWVTAIKGQKNIRIWFLFWVIIIIVIIIYIILLLIKHVQLNASECKNNIYIVNVQ